jgi:hypothetical protein
MPLWSTIRASNQPQGSTTVGTNWDDNLREIQGVTRAWLASKGADIASAATTDLGAVEGFAHDITGTVTITSFGTVSAGIHKVVKFEGALTLTHNATSLILPGGANITTADGDVGWFESEGNGNWRCLAYTRAGVAPLVNQSAVLAFVFDGSGSTLTTGIKGDISVPFACTITGVRLLADQSGSVVIDIWKDAYANYPPTVADTITASAKPTITVATKSEDTTLTGWTKTVAAGDTLRFNIDSVTTLTRVLLTLTVTKT